MKRLETGQDRSPTRKPSETSDHSALTAAHKALVRCLRRQQASLVRTLRRISLRTLGTLRLLDGINVVVAPGR